MAQEGIDDVYSVPVQYLCNVRCYSGSVPDVKGEVQGKFRDILPYFDGAEIAQFGAEQVIVVGVEYDLDGVGQREDVGEFRKFRPKVGEFSDYLGDVGNTPGIAS